MTNRHKAIVLRTTSVQTAIPHAMMHTLARDRRVAAQASVGLLMHVIYFSLVQLEVVLAEHSPRPSAYVPIQ